MSFCHGYNSVLNSKREKADISIFGSELKWLVSWQKSNAKITY